MSSFHSIVKLMSSSIELTIYYQNTALSSRQTCICLALINIGLLRLIRQSAIILSARSLFCSTHHCCLKDIHHPVVYCLDVALHPIVHLFPPSIEDFWSFFYQFLCMQNTNLIVSAICVWRERERPTTQPHLRHPARPLQRHPHLHTGRQKHRSAWID